MNDYLFWKGCTLYCLVGLPRSGKTTVGSILRDEFHWPLISLDAFRLALHGRQFVRESEEAVWLFLRYAVRGLFYGGHKSIILDSCNITRNQRRLWTKNNFKCSFIIINENEETCKTRANIDQRTDLIPLIESMNRQYEIVHSTEGESFYPNDIMPDIDDKIKKYLNLE